jgi:TRAP-type C4-dicarboxylate transport system substrate-binding protein
VTKALKIFGSVPVTMPITETYTALERGVVDGTVVPWEGVFIFKLQDLLKYTTITDFYTVTMAFLMNKDKWESLPEDIKKILEPHIGYSLSEWAGRVYDETNEPMKQRCLKAGMQIVDLDPAVLAKLKEVTDPLRKEWVKEMSDKGFAAQEILDAAIEYIK